MVAAEDSRIGDPRFIAELLGNGESPFGSFKALDGLDGVMGAHGRRQVEVGLGGPRLPLSKAGSGLTEVLNREIGFLARGVAEKLRELKLALGHLVHVAELLTNSQRHVEQLQPASRLAAAAFRYLPQPHAGS